MVPAPDPFSSAHVLPLLTARVRGRSTAEREDMRARVQGEALGSAGATARAGIDVDPSVR